MKEQFKLLEWFQKNQRPLPFRKDKDPYKIWISEVMLQQTRVAAMLPSYEKFILRFPNVSSLASATEEEVIQSWKGLGYYSRAIHLRKGAIYLMEMHHGIFPKDLDSVLKIPGVGPYTARAVLSIAYNKNYAVLDGNVKRVLSRYFLFKENIAIPSAHKKLQELADSFLNPNNSGDHNQAMMELGATVCLPAPLCMLCPIQSHCMAFQIGKQAEYPIVAKEKQKLPIQLKFLFLNLNQKILLVKYKKRRFFKTIFTLPFLINGENLSNSYNDLTEFGGYCKSISETGVWKKVGKHTITHHEIELLQMNFSVSGKNEKDLEKILSSSSSSREIEYKWIDKKDIKIEFPSSIAGKLLLDDK
ncbi:MAG TPA: A/G-specific adenine glycosylase [Leptospiraceae bacterium]|nr:A/G-specific adenine glycosylase [Leptospiraceae bacterium]HMW06849.1 A/G-specific adenine glycosylase [Leptospiraceae bacterium]HMX32249.1 A/G-specific adenine glycosylase [Leptospiraceae bacterium]HMY32368.1 A/G-specific adenine glycosylase [Leptospiraceae bacterium]HMZ66988.1 A/G-specific adenine glycosylase [Leptospiraceae bacterium]